MLVKGINSAASCRYRYVDANTNIEQIKQLLQLLDQNNAANIPSGGENRETVQLITDFFINKAISNVKRERDWSVAPKNTTQATAETNWMTQPL